MKQKFLAIVVALSLLVPTSAGADTVCMVTALDTVAGLGSEVEVKNCDKASSMTLSVRAPNGNTKNLNVKTDAAGNGRLSIPSSMLAKSGTYTLEWNDGSTPFEVLSDAPDGNKSYLATTATMLRPDGQDTVTVTVTLRDRYGNPLPGRPVALLSSREQDRINALNVETDEYGEMSWDVQSKQPGIMTLTAYDILSTLAVSERINIKVGAGAVSENFDAFAAQAVNGSERGGEFGALDHFEVKLLGTKEVQAGEDVSLLITALDERGSVVEDYLGTVAFTSTDSQAVLPGGGQIAFRAAELGVKRISLGLRFRSPGNQSLTVKDTASSAEGILDVAVTRTSGTSEGDIQIIDPPSDGRVSTSTILVQGKAPSLVNLKVIGGKSEAFGETDAEGVFRIQVELNENQTDHTLFIVSDNGRYQSEPHHIVYDKNRPTADSITMEPLIGKSGQPAKILVKAEKSLKAISASVGALALNLSETAPGVYSAEFLAPTPQIYDVRVVMTDQGDNDTVVLSKWTVEIPGADQVKNVKAEVRPNAVALTWDAIPDAAQYRIYVGSSATNFEHALETQMPTDTALVNGLNPGQPYYFALTAINADGQESPEKSVPIMAIPIGLNLTVSTAQESLMLSWEPPANTSLAGYILEYGVESGKYSEKRMINGALRAYTLRDLINDVTYELRLTPVTVTGQKLDVLAAVAHGTPNGQGFGGGAIDPVPNLGSNHGGAPLHPPKRPISVGLPSPVVWALGFGTLVGIAFAFNIRRQRKLARSFLAAMDERYTQ